MSLAAVREVAGRAVPVPGDDIDTDQIIPARFLKCVTFDGLGPSVFFDVRFEADGTTAKSHPLNDAAHAGAEIMVVGRNFGCGSSREHAPQAIAKSGVRAIVGESFAEIFFGNATTLGMPCVCVTREDRERLAAVVAAEPDAQVRVDLVSMRVTAAGVDGGLDVPCTMPEGPRQALLGGHWDPISWLLEGKEAARALAERQPYVCGY